MNTPSYNLNTVAYNINTVQKAFDFQAETGLIAAAVSNLVGIQDYHSGEHPRSLFTLNGHKGRVNAVRWIG
jgi:hypothetical protein